MPTGAPNARWSRRCPCCRSHNRWPLWPMDLPTGAKPILTIRYVHESTLTGPLPRPPAFSPRHRSGCDLHTETIPIFFEQIVVRYSNKTSNSRKPAGAKDFQTGLILLREGEITPLRVPIFWHFNTCFVHHRRNRSHRTAVYQILDAQYPPPGLRVSQRCTFRMSRISFQPLNSRCLVSDADTIQGMRRKVKCAIP